MGMEEARPSRAGGTEGTRRHSEGDGAGARALGRPASRLRGGQEAGESRPGGGWQRGRRRLAPGVQLSRVGRRPAPSGGRPRTPGGGGGRPGGPGPTFSEALLAQAARVGELVLGGGRVGVGHRAAGHGCGREAALVRGAARPSGCPSAGGGAGAGSTPPKIVRPQGGPQRQPPPVSPPRALSCRGTGADGGSRLRVGGEGTLVRGPGEPWRDLPALPTPPFSSGRRHPAPCSESSLFSVLRPLEGGRCREP